MEKHDITIIMTSPWITADEVADLAACAELIPSALFALMVQAAKRRGLNTRRLPRNFCEQFVRDYRNEQYHQSQLAFAFAAPEPELELGLVRWGAAS